MLAAVQSGFNSLLTMMGIFVQALLGTPASGGTGTVGVLGDLLEMFTFGICISLLLFACKLVRKLTWGA